MSQENQQGGGREPHGVAVLFTKADKESVSDAEGMPDIGALGGALASVGVWAKQGGSAATWARGTAPKIALRGAGVGVVAGFAMAAGKAYSNDFVQDDVDDRAYRLMHNGIVNTMDRVTTGACMIGAGCGALGAVVGTQNVAVKVSRGGALGVAVGFAGLAATAVVKKWQSSA